VREEGLCKNSHCAFLIRERLARSPEVFGEKVIPRGEKGNPERRKERRGVKAERGVYSRSWIIGSLRGDKLAKIHKKKGQRAKTGYRWGKKKTKRGICGCPPTRVKRTPARVEEKGICSGRQKRIRGV